MSNNLPKPSDAQAIIGAVTSVLPSARLVMLFGSLARGVAKVDSDMDIAILGTRPLDVEIRVALIESLALQSGRSVDVVDLSSVGEPLLGKILEEGVVLLDADHQRGALLARHLGNVEDFIPLQEFILRTRRQAWTQR